MTKVVDVVVDNLSAVDNLKKAVAERIKLARAALDLTQKRFCEESGMPLPSLKNYEGAKQLPGGEAILMFCRAGINANWLLTGESQMLLANLVAPATAAPPKPVALRINVDALEAIIEGALKVAKNAPPSAIAAHAASVYAKCIEDGLITQEGVGDGNLNAAA